MLKGGDTDLFTNIEPDHVAFIEVNTAIEARLAGLPGGSAEGRPVITDDAQVSPRSALHTELALRGKR